MDKIAERVQQAITEKVFPGCVIGTLIDGEARVAPYGTLAYNDVPVREDTVYDLASVTKAIPLAALCSLFIAEGKFALTDLAKKYVPDLEYDHDATIDDLLRYR